MQQLHVQLSKTSLYFKQEYRKKKQLKRSMSISIAQVPEILSGNRKDKNKQ